MEKMNGLGKELIKGNIDLLKEIFPDCVCDGKIDFETLRIMLGESVENSNEKYGFNWVGKGKALELALTPSSATLLPLKNKSKSFESTKNLYIEGDNLRVLKCLLKTYHGQIKFIYIDPPYNTGKDFVYHDNFEKNKDDYLNDTDQQFKSNPETAGRYHTDWLNMIYPRLKLAYELLGDNGLIFVSIDDTEVDNLKKVMNTVFGEENFVAQIVWTNKEGGGGSDSNLFKIKHEYVLVYGKNIGGLELNGDEVDNEDRYTETDKYVSTRGKHLLIRLESGSLGYIASLDYPIDGPEGPIWPNSDGRKIKRWRWSKQKLEWGLKNDYVVFKKGQDGKYGVYTKMYLNADNEGNIVKRTKTPVALIDKYSTTQSAKELQKLFDGKIFDYPKPLDYIKHFINLIPEKDITVLDFFSGSATTAHAVMQLNSEDGGNRKFIMVQLPEKCPEGSEACKRGYETICDVGEDRIKRAGNKIHEDLNSKYSSAGLFSSEEIDPKTIDLGFKVFKLDSSNIKQWDPTIKHDENSIFDLLDVIKEDRTNLDVAYEVMLKYGVFNMPLEEIQVNGKTVYSVGCGYMIISLNKEITPEDVEAIAKLQPKAVVIKESGFVDDNAKINADYTFKRLGIDNVKCI